eukprot:EG_transcript_7655
MAFNTHVFSPEHIDADGTLSLPNVSGTLAEVAPKKSVENIQRLFRLMGVHNQNHDFSISRSDFATQCAINLDIRREDAEAFFDKVTSQDTVPFTEIAQFVKAGPLLLPKNPGPPSPVTGDLVLLDLDKYSCGQSVWIRYSITRSFLGKQMVDVEDGEKGNTFPLTERTLRHNPVIAMIPYNAKWTNGGGKGFYDPETKIQLKTNAMVHAPLPLHPKDGVVRLHAPRWPGKFKVAVFCRYGDKDFSKMVGAPAFCTVSRDNTHGPDPVQHKQQQPSLKFSQLDVEPMPTPTAVLRADHVPHQGQHHGTNLGQDHLPELGQDCLPGRNHVPDPVQDHVAHPSQDHARYPGQVIVPNPGQDHVSDPGQDDVSDPSQNIFDASQDHVPDLCHVPDASQDNVLDTGQYHRDVGQGHVHDASQDHITDTGQDHIADQGQDHIPDAGQDNVPENNKEEGEEEGEEGGGEKENPGQNHVSDPDQDLGQEHVPDPNQDHNPEDKKEEDEGEEPGGREEEDPGQDHVSNPGQNHVRDPGHKHVPDVGQDYVPEEDEEEEEEEGEEGEEEEEDPGQDHNSDQGRVPEDEEG